MELSLDPRTILRTLWRRKWWFAAPGAIIGLVVLSLLLFSSPVYRSEATIIIEEQQIPEDIVPSLVTDYIDRRLDRLTRRVLLNGNLLEIIERYDLYSEQRDTMRLSSLAELMRDNIHTEFLSTEINDPQTGRSGEMTVAFTIAFEYHQPRQAQRVTDELVSLYLSMNQEDRRRVATQTTEFLASERTEIEQRIADIEDALAAFQTENRELLPQEATFKRQLLANLEQQLQNIGRDMRSLREREGFLETELALTDEFALTDRRAGNAASPETQLEIVRAELATAQARYSARHPDVVRLSRELASLEAVVGDRSTGSRLLDNEQALITELASLRERYTDSHPDVQQVRGQLASVRAAIERAGGRGAVDGGSGAGLPRSDAYVQLSAQLNSVRSEMRSIEEQRRDLEAERRRLQEQLARAPAVEQEYTRLTRSLENAVADREALADKETTAALSGALESESIGEQFLLAEPASMPRQPVRPKEKLIVAIGFILALGSGGAAAAAAELFDRSIRSSGELAKMLGDTPLALVPNISTPAEQRRKWGVRLAAAVAALGIVGGALLWVHLAVRPLDVMGYEIRLMADRWLATRFSGTSATAGGE